MIDEPDHLLITPPAWLPASSVYLRRDEQIRVTSYNALAAVKLTTRARLWRATGGVSDSVDVQTPNTDRTAQTALIRCDEGWLLDGQVVVTTAAPLLGQTFVVVELVRGDLSSPPATTVLAAGYVTAKQPLRFPSPSLTTSLDGQGAVRSIAGTTPAAGAEISETVPTGARWEVIAFQALFTASAGAATRIPVLVVDDGTTVFSRNYIGTTMTAAQAWQCTWQAGGINLAENVGKIQQAPIPVNLRLAAASRLRTATTAIQAGDQWSAVQYLVREWLEGA